MLLKLEPGSDFQLYKDTCQTSSGHCLAAYAFIAAGGMIFDILYVLSYSGDMEHGLLDIQP